MSISDHLEACLRRINAQPDVRDLVFTRLEATEARVAAKGQERKRAPDAAKPLAGRVCTVKACFDVQGWVSHAGSVALRDLPAAASDADMVQALRAAGAILLGQTNMTEFAYGALGVNDAYGTPLTPLLPDEACVAGGSSSGAAVSVARQFADLALCTDTSGSARIPAGFCGVAGYIPSHGAWPSGGLLGLAPTFDTAGIMASSAQHCLEAVEALDLDRIDRQTCQHIVNPSAYRFLVPDEILLAQPEARVLEAFEGAVERLQALGAQIVRAPCVPLRQAGAICGEGRLIAAEAYAIHEHYLQHYGARYDPLIRQRIEQGRYVAAHEYVRARWQLERLALDYEKALEGFDALLTPTSPIYPPPLAALRDQEHYLKTNQQSFAYTEIANRFGLPSISVPGLTRGVPVGTLMTARHGQGRALLRMASTLECQAQKGLCP